ncbi:unnamed protein product [Cladocopium goreaui]|uniref:Uncharacterized protein n=1 Tax=Cladocopium goreaui TaxID=2562237 RepID=A0A9P1M463_9DINO|nr:unnamed protein product [Cladocopium goreaui]
MVCNRRFPAGWHISDRAATSFDTNCVEIRTAKVCAPGSAQCPGTSSTNYRQRIETWRGFRSARCQGGWQVDIPGAGRWQRLDSGGLASAGHDLHSTWRFHPLAFPTSAAPALGPPRCANAERRAHGTSVAAGNSVSVRARSGRGRPAFSGIGHWRGLGV